MNCQECYKSKQNICIKNNNCIIIDFLHYPFLGRRFSVMHGPRNQLFCNILALWYHLLHSRFQEHDSSPGSCKVWRKVASSPQSMSEVSPLNDSMDNALTERKAEGMAGTSPETSLLLSDCFSNISVTWHTMLLLWTNCRKSFLWTSVLHRTELVAATEKFMHCYCLGHRLRAVFSLTSSCWGLMFLRYYSTDGSALTSPVEEV